MELYLLALLSFAVGFLTRIVDLKEDEGLRLPRHSELFLGLLYGLTIAFVFVSWPRSTALIGVFIGLMLTRKIDAAGHYMGLAGLIAGFALWGLPGFQLAPIVLFLVTGILDEFSDWIQEKRKVWRPIAKLFYLRPFTEVAAFVYSGMTGFWEIWIALVFFDIAFIAFDKLGKNINKAKTK